MESAERVTRSASDNFVFARSMLAYRHAAGLIGGDVLEIGTGTGYGIEVLSSHADRFVTLDKTVPAGLTLPHNARFVHTAVPPLPFDCASFDFVVSFQVLEHVRRDTELVREAARVLRPGGRFIVTTPNAPRSLTRNPWHVREYTAGELRDILACEFAHVECMGVEGNAKVAEYYARNRESVARITRFDPLRLQYRLPAWMLRLPYDVLNRLNRRRLLADNESLTMSISEDDYTVVPFRDECYDLFFVAEKR